jgi:hypothetical protein
VYGTALPSYHFDASFRRTAGGVSLKFKATQTNVDDNFRMLIPVYVELADGNVARLGQLRIRGNATIEQEVPLDGVKDLPKRAMLNYYGDVLASE